MTTECCKFCGADKWYVKDDGDGAFECRTTLDYSWRSSECKVATCARYEALFPVQPWSTEPITAETCERLGLTRSVTSHGNVGYVGANGTHVFLHKDREIEVARDPGITTAGQLALLIAARKGAVKQC